MNRSRRSFALFRAVGAVCALALLAACSNGNQTAGNGHTYHVRGNYAPPGPPNDPWGPYIHEASNRFDIPEQWIRALMRQESGGREYNASGGLTTSGAGAMGLMQVMPGTYDELRARHNLGDDPYEPHDNIMAGVAYMREMYDIYGAPGFLAAYNAGPNRLDDYLANNRPLPNETRRYVAIIGPQLEGASPRVQSPAQQFAMNNIPVNIPPGTRYGRSGPPASTYTASLMRPLPSAPVQMAALPAPPPAAPTYVAPPPPPPPVAYAPPSAAPRQTFVLIPSAQAAEPPPFRHTAGEAGQWAIQVGAYTNQNQAQAALSTAKGHARSELAVGRPYVGMVHQAHATLYRARMTGLSHDAAVQACQKIQRSRTSCVVLSPDSQS